MRLVELDRMDTARWEQIVAGEEHPFGDVGAELVWRAKQRHLAVVDEDDRLLGAAGLVPVEIRVGAEAALRVTGLGGVIVTRAARGRGLGRMLIEGALELAPSLGAERAMLFCLPRNQRLYAKFGFSTITGRVSADQPGGRIDVPMPAMWLGLAPGVTWPDGEVAVQGEPF